jgi:hypothetical protein
MNRGLYADFHSAEKSSLRCVVEQVWKLCKSGSKFVGVSGMYYSPRRVRVLFYTRGAEPNMMAAGKLA